MNSIQMDQLLVQFGQYFDIKVRKEKYNSMSQ